MVAAVGLSVLSKCFDFQRHSKTTTHSLAFTYILHLVGTLGVIPLKVAPHADLDTVFVCFEDLGQPFLPVRIAG